jgi:DNA-binding Lrp family transcriptional regulator
MALAKKGRIEAVRTLKAHHDREFTINELARTAGIPVMTAWRAVKELKKIGIVKTRKVGNATSVTLCDDKERLKALRLIPDTDPNRTSARHYAKVLSVHDWLVDCRLFGNIGKGENSPGDEVDVAVVYDQDKVTEHEARAAAADAAQKVREETNIVIVPLCIQLKEMSRRGGLATELRDKEIIWKRAE